MCTYIYIYMYVCIVWAGSTPTGLVVTTMPCLPRYQHTLMNTWSEWWPKVRRQALQVYCIVHTIYDALYVIWL